MDLENTEQFGIQTGIDSLGQDSEPSSGVMNKLFQNTELLSMVLDMVGSGVDPKNPFAGIGTKLAKSSLAAKAAAGEEKKSEDMISKILKSFTGVDEQGPTKLTASLNKDGSGIDYNVSGIESLGGEKKVSKASKLSQLSSITPASEFTGVLTAEDFVADFGENENL